MKKVKNRNICVEELAPYADEEVVRERGIDMGVIMELYRAAQERIYEEETTLQKLLAWTTSFLNHQLLTNSIPDNKLVLINLLPPSFLTNLISHFDLNPVVLVKIQGRVLLDELPRHNG